MIRCFEVIGEAVKQLSPEIRKNILKLLGVKLQGFEKNSSGCPLVL
ncbi:MAG: hypothetical protein ACOVO7_03855 [Microcystis aeruginosa]